ncbi:MAG TPA: response regulator transcription factor [Chitinophagales bacterium]|nr:response regulator transcription factor [Chitinophagales bacterium]
MSKINVLIADDHEIFRSGIKALLSEAGGMAVVAEANNGNEVLQQLKKKKIDVVLMDVNMPECNGTEATRLIKSKFPDVKVLALTMYDDDHHVVDMLDAGAAGYVMKNVSRAELISAIQSVARGESYLSKEASDRLVAHIIKSRKESGKKKDEIPLTERETEVLRLIASELSPREIAQKLFISQRTVDTHRRNLMEKLRLKNTASLVKYAISKGYVDEPSKA